MTLFTQSSLLFHGRTRSFRILRGPKFWSSTQRMYSQRPSWLEHSLSDTGTAPRLFAWSPSNIDSQNLKSPTYPDQREDLDRRIFVLGIGNLGRLFASSLAQSSDHPPVTLVVHRRELLSEWTTSKGIEILRNGVLQSQKNFDIEWWTETRPNDGPIQEVAGGRKLQNLIITTKATAALPQVDRVRRYLNQASTIAFAQNGMSKLWPPHGPTYASHRFPDRTAPNFLACVTTHGVTSQGAFRSLHASQADVAVGAVLPNAHTPDKANYLIDQITKAPFLDGRKVSRTDLWVLQLEKLVVNAVINPLTAILRCKNGDLFIQSPEIIEQVIDQLLTEASRVLQALIGHKSSSEILLDASESGSSSTSLSRGSLLTSQQQQLLERFSQPQLKEMVYRVGHKVKDNTSSMLQDVQAGKSTEIRDFNGWIVETAAFLDQSLDVRAHQFLIDLVESGEILTVNHLESRFRTMQGLLDGHSMG